MICYLISFYPLARSYFFINYAEFVGIVFKMVTLPVKTSIGCMEFGRQCSAEQVDLRGFSSPLTKRLKISS